MIRSRKDESVKEVEYMQQAGPDWHAKSLRLKLDLYTTMPTFEAGVGIQSNGYNSVLQCTRGTFHAISSKGFLLCYSTQRLQQPERCSSFKDSLTSATMVFVKKV